MLPNHSGEQLPFNLESTANVCLFLCTLYKILAENAIAVIYNIKRREHSICKKADIDNISANLLLEGNSVTSLTDE